MKVKFRNIQIKVVSCGLVKTLQMWCVMMRFFRPSSIQGLKSKILYSVSSLVCSSIIFSTFSSLLSFFAMLFTVCMGSSLWLRVKLFSVLWDDEPDDDVIDVGDEASAAGLPSDRRPNCSCSGFDSIGDNSVECIRLFDLFSCCLMSSILSVCGIDVVDDINKYLI